MSIFGSLQTAGIIADGDDIRVTGQIVATKEIFEKFTVSTITTTAAVTYTAAQLIGKLIKRDPNGADRSDITPTAAQIVAAISDAKVGTGFIFHIINDADAAETITVTAGTNVTLSGEMTVGQNEIGHFAVVVTAIGSTPTVSIYNLGDTAV